MSKKKPVRAIDEFMPDGSFTRSLVFESPKGKTEIIPFPTDSMVIIRTPTELYDWYGRKVKLSPKIHRILRFYGSEANGSLVDSAKELFLAEKANGKLTLATLTMDRIYDKNRNFLEPIQMPWFKQVRTGCYMNRQPTIVPGEYEFGQIDNSILETPVVQAFILGLPTYYHKDKIDLFTGLTGGTLDKRYAYTVIRKNISSSFNWMFSCFAENRDAIMHATEEPTHGSANYLLGNITVSEDGTKLSAVSPSRYFRNEERYYRTISTDIEVVKHMYRKDGQSNLWWYYDGGEIKESPTTP